MKRILVAEASEVVRKVMQEILCHMGFEVECVWSARGAVRMIQFSDYDLLIMDFSVQSADSVQVLRLIKKRWPKLRVICTSADPRLYRDRFIEAGAETFLPKPFDTSGLLDAVNTVLKTPMSRQS